MYSRQLSTGCNGRYKRDFKEKLYNALGLETSDKRRWNSRNTNNIPLFKVKPNSFENPVSLLRLLNGTNWTKYSQFRKFEYLQENSFEIHKSS